MPISRHCRSFIKWWINPSINQIGIPLQDPIPDLHLFSDANLTCWGSLGTSRPIYSGPLRTRIPTPTHQQSGVESCLSGSSGFPIPYSQQMCYDSFGQFVCSSLPKETGRNPLPIFMHSCVGAPILVQSSVYNYSGSPHSRKTERSSGKPIASKLCPSNGMVSHLPNYQYDFRILGTPQLDRFATRLNNRFPLVVSLVPDHRACAVDAMSMDWKNRFTHAFPPFNLIPLVLSKIKNFKCNIILIAPLWPQRSWFSMILDLLIDYPRKRPVLADLVYCISKSRQSSLSQPGNLHPWPEIVRDQIRGKQFSEFATPCITQSRRSSTFKVYARWKIFFFFFFFFQIGVKKGKSILSTRL